MLLPKVVGPVITGTGIVMTVSFLERVILDSLRRSSSEINWVKLNNDNWRRELGMNLEWPGWPLIDGLTSLRHCFAHEYGRVTQRQLTPLKNLSRDLAAHPIQINWCDREFSIGQFFSINLENDEIILMASNDMSPSQSIRITFLSFLEELEKVNIVDMREWKEGTS